MEDFNFVTMEERPIYVEDVALSTHKAIYNPETKRTVSVVGNGYQLVDNNTVFGQFEDAIRLSGLDSNGMERDIQTSHGGGRTVVSYTFPEHKVQVKEDDYVDLKLTILNSYDTSWRFRVLGGAFRLLCANGMIVGDTFLEYSGKHTASLDTERAIANLDNSLQGFLATADLWKQYPKVKINEVQAASVFDTLAKGSKTMLKYLDECHKMYVDELGSNLWALFNTLTEWSSHHEIKNKQNAPSIIVNREERVRKLLPILEDLRLAA